MLMSSLGAIVAINIVLLLMTSRGRRLVRPLDPPACPHNTIWAIKTAIWPARAAACISESTFAWDRMQSLIHGWTGTFPVASRECAPS